MPKLLITIGMSSALHRFLVDFERIALLMEYVGQCCPLDAMSLPKERLDQVRQRMRRPFDQAHRIPFGLQQRLQIPLQGLIRHHCLLPPTSGLADPPLHSRSFSRELFDPSLNRLPIRSRERRYLTDATRADLERFCSQIQAPLLLIQFFPQDLVLLLCRHSLTIPYFPVSWKLFADEPLVNQGAIVGLLSDQETLGAYQDEFMAFGEYLRGIWE